MGGSGNTIGGLVTLAGGSSAATQGTIDLTVGGLTNTVLKLNGGLTIGGSSAGNVSRLNFNLAPSGNASDLINLGSTALTGNAGGGVINIGTTFLNNATYTLIDYGSESGLTPGTSLTVGTHPTQLFTNLYAQFDEHGRIGGPATHGCWNSSSQCGLLDGQPRRVV